MLPFRLPGGSGGGADRLDTIRSTSSTPSASAVSARWCSRRLHPLRSCIRCTGGFWRLSWLFTFLVCFSILVSLVGEVLTD